jgi:hypothetical protein
VSEILDLPVTHTSNVPVFVIGAARSGTSILCTLIRRYLKISFGTESQFILRVYQTLPRYGNLQDDAHLHRLVDDIAKERCFRRWIRRFGFTIDKERAFLRAARGRRDYATVLEAFFEQLANHHGMQRWGDKTPEYNSRLPVLLSLFPNAQFVHIVRDGRDVALSGFKMHFGAGNSYHAAVEWRRTMLNVGRFSSTLPDNQIFTLRYEAFLRDPVETMGRLSDFLGIANTSELLPAIAADIPQQLHQGNGEKWPAKMSLRDQRVYEAVAGDELRAAGYPTPHGVQRRIGRAEHAYWEANHLVHKLFRKEYWSDTVYRAGLRWRALATSARD